MGREATCTARLGRKRSTGKALLETAELLFRGEGLRVAVPFREMTDVRADDVDLSVTWPGGTLVLALGAQAPRWADKIRNPPSRLDKLGIKPDTTVALVGDSAELHAFAAEVEARGAKIAKARAAAVDMIFLAADDRAALAGLAALKKRIHPAGAVWVLRPKGRPAITESDVRTAARNAGLVDVKVAAFSPTHTAAKYVIPAAARARS
jgi:hypothetical protein